MFGAVFPVREKATLPGKDASSSSDESETEAEEVIPVSSSFRCCQKEKKIGMGNLFMLDREGGVDDDAESSSSSSDEEDDEEVMDNELKAVLAKAVVKPGFEQHYGSKETLSLTQQKKLRAAEREKTSGKGWFDMPATELTDERKKDLELLMLRGALDPRAYYRKNDRKVLPKYFQVGRVVDTPEDWYSGRLTNKYRKKTMVDELLADSEGLAKAKKKYEAIKTREKTESLFHKRAKRQSEALKKKEKIKGKKK